MDITDKYCSGCNQKQPYTQFRGRLTCISCRYAKSQRRKPQLFKPYLTPTLQQIEDHLQERVAARGEYELKLQKRQRWRCDSVLLGDRRRPLTVKDYINEVVQ